MYAVFKVIDNIKNFESDWPFFIGVVMFWAADVFIATITLLVLAILSLIFGALVQNKLTTKRCYAEMLVLTSHALAVLLTWVFLF